MGHKYEEAESYINGIPRFNGQNGMEDTVKFLEYLGNPARSCKIVHVAGTNGKGSVCAYLCSVFQEAEISAGMFISPHLVTMRERFVANGKIATEEEFLEAFHTVSKMLSVMSKEPMRKAYRPTFSEFLFFMAMVFFERKGVEYAVLETGMGGRLDATNSVRNKEVCVITSVGYDHMEYLGDTLSDIAAEKAGIMRPGVPVIYPVGQEEAVRRIEECAARAGAESIPLRKQAIKEIKIRNKTIDFSLHLNYYDYIGFTVSTPAVYQVENASLAVMALMRLQDGRITRSVLQEGIRKMAWEGRMEEILPSVYLDGAHNIDGIQAFLETVRSHPCQGRRKLLYSAVKDKKYQEAAAAIALSGLFDEIGVAPLVNQRALPLRALEDSYRQYTGFICKAYNDLDTAFRKLVQGKDDEDIVYIVGSLYLAGEIKALLRRPRHD